MYIGQGIIRYCKLHRYFLLIEFFFSFLGQCFVHVSNICCLPHEYKIFTAFTRGMVAFIKWSCFHICIVKIQQRLCHHLLLFFVSQNRAPEDHVARQRLQQQSSIEEDLPTKNVLLVKKRLVILSLYIGYIVSQCDNEVLLT